MKEKTIDVEKFENWLTQNWKGNKACPICDANNWSVSEKILALREYPSSGLVISDIDVYPLATVTCNSCGYTYIFNAIVAGLMKSK